MKEVEIPKVDTKEAVAAGRYYLAFQMEAVNPLEPLMTASAVPRPLPSINA